ncbi:DUF6046 domain-containing protein [Flammeovirga sp. OC4]|uniref:DUF6046 domain-containing protein n=1 Tax=Flammeovirga sp. OC4 TaxID=1382345 RepID=UPI0005C6D8EC|nr:DUF6046 domain-containing protein [Flammeovirga sp. OC4]
MKIKFNQHNVTSTALSLTANQAKQKALSLAININDKEASLPSEKEADRKAIDSASIDVYTEKQVDNLVFESEDGSDRFEFAITPLIDPKRKKHLITTPINNGLHEIVELVNIRGWEISFRGILVDDENHNYPLNQVRALNAFFEKHKTAKAYHERLEVLGIQNIVFVDLSLPPIEGNADTQQFSILARSIQSPEVKLLEA